ncbi:MAG: hypothetical protein M3474_05455 [Actinomycetota bacterium]|nr:hypothetical protein [Actinomycetota bacterium]
MVDVFPQPPRDQQPEDPQSLTVDCDDCMVCGPACADCVVTVLLGPPRARLELDADEVSALDALAGAGLVPPLRLVAVEQPPQRPAKKRDSPHTAC